MKSLFNLILFAFISLNLAIAQAPQAIKYQAVARDGSGLLLASQNVSFQFSIRSSGPAGAIEYQETHNVTTNNYGLANLEIGRGTIVSGNFADIDWGANSHFLEVALDPNGGSSFMSMGTSEMVSVPYAQFSNFSEEATRAEEADYAMEAEFAHSVSGSDYHQSTSLNNNSLNLTDTYTKFGDYLTFTKNEDVTNIELYFNSRIYAGAFNGAFGTYYELRIDDMEADFQNRGAITASNTIQFVSMMAVFQNLPAGTHTVSVWGRTSPSGSTTTGTLLDTGGWGGRIVAKETW